MTDNPWGPTEYDLVVKELELQDQANADLMIAKQYVVVNDRGYTESAAAVKVLRGKVKEVQEIFRRQKELTDQAHKEVCRREASLIAPFNEAVRLIQNAMLTYSRQMDEAAAKAREEERARALAELVGSITEAVPEDRVEPTVIESLEKPMGAPKVAGVSTRKGWAFEVEDETKVPDSFGGSKLRVVDEAAIAKLVKAGIREIPGIRIYQTEKLIAGGRWA